MPFISKYYFYCLQKTFLEILVIGNGYRSMKGRYIGIGPKKAISIDLYWQHTYF